MFFTVLCLANVTKIKANINQLNIKLIMLKTKKATS